MTQGQNYKVEIKVTNEVGVLARISTLLRKFNVNIGSMDAAPVPGPENFTTIHLVMASSKSDFNLVMKKLERLVPVVEVRYEEV